uniref:Uncharacterized protein n=1 Tax=Opuntia streptacantha TaxID=393608 RepID=A0A7C9EIR4_OPUST
MISVVGATDACLAVKGEAIEASPSLTMGAERPSPSSFISSSNLFSFCCCFSTAVKCRLPAVRVEDSGFERDLFFERPSLLAFTAFPSSEEGLGFLDFDFIFSFLEASEESPVCAGGTAFSKATPT